MFSFFFFNDTATTEIYTLSLHDALPISGDGAEFEGAGNREGHGGKEGMAPLEIARRPFPHVRVGRGGGRGKSVGRGAARERRLIPGAGEGVRQAQRRAPRRTRAEAEGGLPGVRLEIGTDDEHLPELRVHPRSSDAERAGGGDDGVHRHVHRAGAFVGEREARRRNQVQVAEAVLARAARVARVERHRERMEHAALYAKGSRSEEHTSELQSRLHLVCRLLLEKKKKKKENGSNTSIGS